MTRHVNYLRLVLIAIVGGFIGAAIVQLILMFSGINKNHSPLSDAVTIEQPDGSIKRIPF